MLEIILDNCCNLACTKNDHKVNESLTEHSKTFKQGIYKIANIFYLAVGYGISNVTFVDGQDGIIVIDTGESYEMAEKIYNDFKKIVDKPIKSIIYTHNHLDHIAGVKAFITKEQVESGQVKIFAHRKIMEGIINNASVVHHIINTRAISSFGLLLETDTFGHINVGIGPKFNVGKATFIYPTDFVDEELQVNSCGINIILKYAPSETDDEIFIYFPDYELVQSADIIMGESYPNLYSIRGTHNRDAIKWYESIDKMRRLKPKYFIPSHGRPLEGEDVIYSMLTAYRDAIQYTHDQAVRYINKGYTPDELVQVVSCLPDNLKQHPWLQEFYGTVKHSVKQIYHGYLGWFEGDPTFLDSIDPKTKAKNYIQAFGGRSKVLSIACTCIDEEDYKWAAEILTYLITWDKTDKIARSLKSSCLKELAYRTKNTNWRNWYLTSAKELDETINYDQAVNHGCDSRDIINEIPVSTFLKRLCIMLNTELTTNTHVVMQFNIMPENFNYCLEIRYCVVEFHCNSDHVSNIDYSITISNNVIRDIFLKNITLDYAVNNGLITFNNNTDINSLRKFFSYFDLETKQNPSLVLPHL